jgi:hypothetical protein
MRPTPNISMTDYDSTNQERPMSYAMLVLGNLEVSPEAWERYLGIVVDPARRDDWLGELRVHTTSEARTVAELLEWLPKNVSAWLTFHVDPQRPQLGVRGVLLEDDFDEEGVVLAELFRAASEVGGRGELAFLDSQVIPGAERDPSETYLVRVAPGESSVGHAPVGEQRRILLSDGFRELASAVLASLDDETRAVFEAEMAKRWKKLAAESRSTRAKKTKKR